MIRVIHHIADVPAALREFQRSISPGGCFVLEYANKRNLKAVSRYALHRQSWSPYTREPVEFVMLNFDFHPTWMAMQLQQAGFITQRTLAVSYLRTKVLKRVMPVRWMVVLDSLLQLTAPLGVLSPSVFTCNVNRDAQALDGQALCGDQIFRSPRSGAALRREGDILVCDADGTRWHAKGNFYDFKEPL